MPGFEIRELASEDAAIAAETVGLFKESDGDPARVSAVLQRDDCHLVVCLQDDRPVGFVLAYELLRPDGKGPMMFVYEIEVTEGSRRRGIGRGLIDCLKALCRERGCSEMFVISNASNEAAMRLYASTGARRDADDDVVLVYYPPTFA